MSAYIVFVRFFFDYPATFPFGRFAKLCDDEVGLELEKLGKEWSNNPAKQRALKRMKKEQRQRLKAWDRGALSKPSAHTSIIDRIFAELSIPIPEKREIPTGSQSSIGRASQPVTDEPWSFATQHDRECISNRFPVALIEKKYRADAACEALQHRADELARATLAKTRSDDIFFGIANPHFSVIPESGLTQGQKITVRDQINRLSQPRGDCLSQEEGCVRAYLSEIQRVLDMTQKDEDPVEILFHGGKAYSICGSGAITVTDPENAILQEFMAMPTTDTKMLKSKSGNDRAPRILGELKRKYNGVFAPAIHLPGAKGKGGYHVSVRSAKPPKS